MSLLGSNYVSIRCHVVIGKDSRFRLVKQLRLDTSRFTKLEFGWTGINLSQGSMKFDLFFTSRPELCLSVVLPVGLSGHSEALESYIE